MSDIRPDALDPPRPDFTIQTSLGEYTSGISPKAPPTFIIGEPGSDLYSKRQSIGDYWLESLHPDTTLSEALQLAGVEDPSERAARIHRLFDRAEGTGINIGTGDTVGDILASGAPGVYVQLFHEEPSSIQPPHSGQ